MKLIFVILPALFSLVLLQGCAGGLIAATGTAVAVSSDERTLTQQIDDDSLSVAAIDKVIALDIYNESMRINIITNNSYILLIGQVKNQTESDFIESTLNELKGVKGVYNQLRINQPIGVIQQTRDAWITTKVKSELTRSDSVNPFKIKVVTENAEVFLIGQVTEKMSNAATTITRKIGGVKQVVRVFELIPEKATQ